MTRFIAENEFNDEELEVLRNLLHDELNKDELVDLAIEGIKSNPREFEHWKEIIAP